MLRVIFTFRDQVRELEGLEILSQKTNGKTLEVILQDSEHLQALLTSYLRTIPGGYGPIRGFSVEDVMTYRGAALESKHRASFAEEGYLYNAGKKFKTWGPDWREIKEFPDHLVWKPVEDEDLLEGLE